MMFRVEQDAILRRVANPPGWRFRDLPPAISTSRAGKSNG